MKNTNIAIGILLLVLWTCAFISNFIKSDISTISYILMYLAFILEICKDLFLIEKINRE